MYIYYNMQRSFNAYFNFSTGTICIGISIAHLDKYHLVYVFFYLVFRGKKI